MYSIYLVQLLIQMLANVSGRVIDRTFRHRRETTLIFLSDKCSDCLTNGIFQAFGVATKDASASALLRTCVLYEGRNLGISQRDALVAERPRLIDRCVKKDGG